MSKEWETRKFENCIEKIDYTNKIQRKDFLENGKHPIISQEQDFINGYWNNTDDLFEINKPVVIFGDHTKVLKYVDFDFVLGADGVKILQPNNEIESRYFYYYLLNINLGSLGYARHYRILKEVDVRYPKFISEQRRIVAILDEAFAAIATARENAVKNLANARELFESYLQDIFANPGDGWVEKKMSDIAIEITDGDHMPPPKSIEGIPFITISNINKDTNQIDFSDTFKVSTQYYENIKPSRKPIMGDILYTVTGSYGVPVLINNDFKFCFQRHIGLIRPKKNFNPKFIYYWIMSPSAINQANETATGTAQKTVSLKALRNFVIPVTSFDKQTEIVAKLDALSAETKRLEGIYQQKIADLDELKKSILDRAFRGEM